MKEKHLKPLILNFAGNCGGGVLKLPNSELSEALHELDSHTISNHVESVELS